MSTAQFIPVLLMFLFSIISCKSKKITSEEVQNEELHKKEITMEPLQLTPDLVQALYQMQSGHIVHLVDSIANRAVYITQTAVQASEEKLHVQFKGIFDDDVLLFESDVERIPGNITRWVGQNKGIKLILTHRPDTVPEAAEELVGDMAFKQSVPDVGKEYFEVGIIMPGKSDTIKLSFWSNFYVDHRLHAHWVLMETVGSDIDIDAFIETPYFELYIPSMKIVGFDGCNRVFGSFRQIGRNIDFKQAASTKRMCESIPQLLPILQKGITYRIEGERLILEGERGAEIIFDKAQ